MIPSMASGPRRTRPGHRCAIIPAYILENIARRGTAGQRDAAVRALAIDPVLRQTRESPTPTAAPSRLTTTAPGPQRTVSTAHGTTTLPGTSVRAEGEGPSNDVAVDEAYLGLGATYDLYFDVFERRSIDDADLPLPATVHYGKDYDNAFWDGERMVFGDGDGDLFQRFTVAIDVIGHELTHGVTAATADFTYQGASGALNESVSDVFGSMVKQRALDQDAREADWLIGAGLFTAAVQGAGLRSMLAPGTAYDDDVLGRDPQPAHMRDYVRTTEDNGGVHVNSGIPNHAFFLAAVALGGRSWEGAGQIWFDALVHGSLAADADFPVFATATVAAARERFGAAEASMVRSAWDAVGVTVAVAGRG